MSTAGIEPLEDFKQRAGRWVRDNLEPLTAYEGLETEDEGQLEMAEDARRVQRRIFDAGFAGLRYPRRYGGQELAREYQLGWREVTTGYRVPHAFTVTHGIIGPTLLELGSEEQKLRHLPAMLKGEELWVQFLSEPSGGSDLAGLLSRARREGDGFLLSGSKIWSTGAHLADYALVLARTDINLPKHQGLSMFMMPVRSPGVTINPIRLITGGSHFCEEFFDGVELPRDSLIGEENAGWGVATRLLFHERNTVSGNSLNDHPHPGHAEHRDDGIVATVRAVGRSADPRLRQLVGEALVLEALAEHTVARVNALAGAGRLPPQAAALLKLMNGQHQYRLREIALEIGGSRAVMAGKDDPVGVQAQKWLGARIGTLGGGSSEIQRNIISERVLGLPREESSDRGIPFREVLARRRR